MDLECRVNQDYLKDLDLLSILAVQVNLYLQVRQADHLNHLYLVLQVDHLDQVIHSVLADPDFQLDQLSPNFQPILVGLVIREIQQVQNFLVDQVDR